MNIQHRQIFSVPDLPVFEKYVSCYESAGGKTILHYFAPGTGEISGPYTEGIGTEPTVAEAFDAAIEALQEYGKKVGTTMSAEFRLPSGRKLHFCGTGRLGNVVCFERP